ncbi:MAG: SCO family protein, partial [Betaproteobacteria bacterium]|nr:SCO family protein [Betaproteobacteria bacterium]
PRARAAPGRIALLGSIALVAAALAGTAGWLLGRQGPAPHETLPVLFKAPEFRGLINQNGIQLSSAHFRGKALVVTFLFPYCNTFCPVVAAHLVGFENLLASTPLAGRVDVVAFDVDPGDTGPRQMRAFLREYGWNPANPRWQFLTGRPTQIRRVVSGGYHVDYQKVPDAPASAPASPQAPAALAVAGSDPQPIVANPLATRADVDYDITHEDVMMIVDPQGRVRKIYDQADAVGKMRLLRDVRAALGRP